ncbi:putative bZIP transcription factor [Tothia fuscella]|uniref:BZIP transcription factor n=1 Tax=Tothia fuscella TaxID=1048955 RepID=A0A9P4P110_9PEZI|nr:putative bZIP transcription factor [Tothia fuscella]
MPIPNNQLSEEHGPTASTDADQMSSYNSSRSGSASEAEESQKHRQRQPRPKLHTRKSSGTIIIPRDTKIIVAHDEHYDEGDARTMSPRRSSEEVERLEEGARQTMIEQAKALQESLSSIVEQVESVKAEHEKLEGGNKFLQSYIGELMNTSKITSSGKNKGKGRSTK